nr:Chain D, Protein diaphanous homolog 3 [Homo sapiens]
VEALLARLRAL